MTFQIRTANLGELSALSSLCLRSKAVWGYGRDPSLLELGEYADVKKLRAGLAQLDVWAVPGA